MTLVDSPRAEALYQMMGTAIEISRGSVGNTMAGIASLGGTGAYIGKVRDDFLGQVYRHDITATGIRFETAAATTGLGTACCLILVSRALLESFEPERIPFGDCRGDIPEPSR